MLTDELPATWHSDEYIKEWARKHCHPCLITRVPLRSVVPHMEAVIDEFGKVERRQDPLVLEMQRKASTVTAAQEAK